MAMTHDEAILITGQADTTRSVSKITALRESLDALQREYEAFVESSFRTLAVIAEKRIRTE